MHLTSRNGLFLFAAALLGPLALRITAGFLPIPRVTTFPAHEARFTAPGERAVGVACREVMR